MGLSNELSCEAGSFFHHLNPHRCFQSKALRLYFPRSGALCCEVCLAPQLFLPVYLQANVGPPTLLAAAWSRTPAAALPSPPAVALLQSPLNPGLPVSSPPTSLDECFFLNSWVVGLFFPYSLIFWQFWLFFVFKIVVVLLWVV